MATIRVEVFDQSQKAQQRKSQLVEKGFEVSGPDQASDAIWDATSVGGKQDGVPAAEATVWVIVGRKS